MGSKAAYLCYNLSIGLFGCTFIDDVGLLAASAGTLGVMSIFNPLFLFQKPNFITGWS